MASGQVYSCAIIVSLLFSVSCCNNGLAADLESHQTARLDVDASWKLARKVPETLFGLFFEVGSCSWPPASTSILFMFLWRCTSLIVPRKFSLTNSFIVLGFEAGGRHTPSNTDPWGTIGDESSIAVMTEQVSCFTRNIVALRMEVLCDKCPAGGVGIYNPGFWGMNIEEGKMYNLVMYVKSPESVELRVSLTCARSSSALPNLASASIQEIDMASWNKIEVQLLAQGTCRTSRLDITTSKRGVIWFDQVSLMPSDTYKGHGFRKELIHMLLDLKPRFLRFPGGCFVEGNKFQNAFRWKNTVGPWEERPGHYGDVWNYWTDDGLGFYEFLQKTLVLCRSGFSMLDAIDGIEFARGGPESKWGSLRAAMGHTDPFPLNYVAIGNEDCEKRFYLGNYIKFYNAIRQSYPDIQIISNCNGLKEPLVHPADFYDFHIYTNATDLFLRKNMFDNASRMGPKAFVSEYAVVNEKDYSNATLFASLAEAAFLTSLEKNGDVVAMASYAPLFLNQNDHKWQPDAIVFNSWQYYGTPSYWMQTFFRESSGALVHPFKITSNYSSSLAASVITWQDNRNVFLRVKIINFGPNVLNVTISVTGLQSGVNSLKSSFTVLTSNNMLDGNSFENPQKVTEYLKKKHVRLCRLPKSCTMQQKICRQSAERSGKRKEKENCLRDPPVSDPEETQSAEAALPRPSRAAWSTAYGQRPLPRIDGPTRAFGHAFCRPPCCPNTPFTPSTLALSPFRSFAPAIAARCWSCRADASPPKLPRRTLPDHLPDILGLQAESLVPFRIEPPRIDLVLPVSDRRFTASPGTHGEPLTDSLLEEPPILFAHAFELGMGKSDHVFP
ncbi:hypothetical protein PR202_ga04124 [Eleusine coracana subsp. coracana]|uniref:non-reducing end alpha-L-arabinofuranosidase n=1 Tax=Eleusine coracana subsp. coracana TaxID=191504 RepID=A0AAV5BR71_ELECO|nr:hypothetical protein PR202_ga04124 [Eleusine coracana subsp. coracana]